MHTNERATKLREVLGEFGVLALSSGDLDSILTEACRLVIDELGQHHAKIVQARPDFERIYIRAERGFDLSEDERWIEKGRGSSAGLCIDEGEPVVSSDAQNDLRFDLPAPLRRQGIRSVCNVPIANLSKEDDHEWWGALEVDSHDLDAFSKDDVAFLRLYANLIAAALDRQRASRQLIEAAEEKDRLLSELQHRIGNNLTVIASIVRVEAGRAEGEEAKRRLEAVDHRVEGLRLVHSDLYSGRKVHSIDLGDYLPSLIGNLAQFHGFAARGVRTDVVADSITVEADRAVALGQVVAEFVTNSLKYAWAAHEGGLIELRVREEADRTLIQLRDDGSGLPQGLLDGGDGGGGRSGSIGLTIIKGLCRQAGGAGHWSNEDGAVLTVTLRPGG